MIGKRLFIALCFVSAGLSLQQAQAQTFTSSANPRRQKPAQEDFIDNHSTLQKSFDDFNVSLDSTSNRMRKDYDDSVAATFEKNRLEAKANQTDTMKVSNDMYQNTQREALDSGGLYNTPAYGYGGGVFVAPNVSGRYYASAPRTGSFNRGGGGRRR